jgi:ATP adenylyltransferase
MERLWAPWRLQYVNATDNKKEQCVFCDQEGVDDELRKILYRGNKCIVIMNIFPYNNGHLMIAPRRHISKLTDLDNEEKLEIMDLLAKWTEILTRAMNCHGFNVGLNMGRIAGAGIDDHMHFHIVPRWNGDTNFMPVLTDIKVIPQSLEDCFSILKKTMMEMEDGQ